MNGETAEEKSDVERPAASASVLEYEEGGNGGATELIILSSAWA